MNGGNDPMAGEGRAVYLNGDSRTRDIEPIRVTTVRTQFLEGHHNHRVLFGNAQRIETLEASDGSTREIHRFTPGSRFGLDLWRRNAYGTTQRRCFVCEAVDAGVEADSVPFVSPVVLVLLQTKGAAQSKLFLAWLAERVASGMDPLTCARETFEAVHFRLQGSRADQISAQRLSGEAVWP